MYVLIIFPYSIWTFLSFFFFFKNVLQGTRWLPQWASASPGLFLHGLLRIPTTMWVLPFFFFCIPCSFYSSSTLWWQVKEEERKCRDVGRHGQRQRRDRHKETEWWRDIKYVNHLSFNHLSFHTNRSFFQTHFPLCMAQTPFQSAMQLVGSEFLQVLNEMYQVWLPARSVVQEAIENRFSVSCVGGFCCLLFVVCCCLSVCYLFVCYLFV